jgi:hypothetical protein
VQAARALLGWKRCHLAAASHVAESIVEKLESGPGPLTASGSIVAALRSALEHAGIDFLDQHGVRMRPRGLPLQPVNAARAS